MPAIDTQIISEHKTVHVLNDILKEHRFAILDGATGTEIEKRVDIEEAWKGNVGLIHLDRPDALAAVHEDYIQAGADIIITNTYLTNRNVLHACGKDDKTEEAIRKAADIAISCAEKSNKRVLVAGSVGSHRTSSPHEATVIPAEEGREELNYEEAATTLLNSGVDLIFLEMIKDLVHGPTVIRGVARAIQKCAHPCPIFLGISTHLKHGKLNLMNMDIEFTVDVFKSYLAEFDAFDVKVHGVNIMHTPFDAVLPTINIIKEAYEGMLGVYPDVGVYEFPNYRTLTIENEEAIRYCNEWLEAGVEMIGGCCGLGPEFIKLLQQTYRGNLS